MAKRPGKPCSISLEKARVIRKLYLGGNTQGEIALIYGVSHATICRICVFDLVPDPMIEVPEGLLARRKWLGEYYGRK
jgi:hypothetical protein